MRAGGTVRTGLWVAGAVLANKKNNVLKLLRPPITCDTCCNYETVINVPYQGLYADLPANCRHCRHVVGAKRQTWEGGQRPPSLKNGPLTAFTRAQGHAYAYTRIRTRDVYVYTHTRTRVYVYTRICAYAHSPPSGTVSMTMQCEKTWSDYEQ